MIAVSACEKIAEQTPSGIRNTHSSVHERFDFDIVRDIVAYFLNLVERKFAGDDEPLEAVVDVLAGGVLVR